jgi:hypothetical protein
MRNSNSGANGKDETTNSKRKLSDPPVAVVNSGTSSGASNSGTKKRKVSDENLPARNTSLSVENTPSKIGKSSKKKSNGVEVRSEEEEQAMQIELPASNSKQKTSTDSSQSQPKPQQFAQNEHQSMLILRESRLRVCHCTLLLLIDFFTQLVCD